LIEGNSFLNFIDADFTVMVTRAGGGKIKPSARRALLKSSALYLSGGDDETAATARERFASWREGFIETKLISALPVYTREDLPQLFARVLTVHSNPVA
jgi:hypothetical protein